MITTAKHILCVFLPAAVIITAEPSWSATVIVCPADAPANVKLAASEVRRYVWLRTDTLLPIVANRAEATPAITLKTDPALAQEQYRLRTEGGGLAISGGSDVAVLYGAYAFAEKLGVRFELQGDVIPDAKISFAIPSLDESASPLFNVRGIQPFHDFTEGPDWWSADDYKAYFAQLAKLRMNFAGFHCYPEGGVGPEPLVWIGLPEDVNDDGTVQASYPSRWASTSSSTGWGYTPMMTSDYAAGAALLFPSDDFGAPVTDGLRPQPKEAAQSNELFNRTGRFLNDVFSFGRGLGLQICIGTETPLRLPKSVMERLKHQGLDPTAPATVQRLYVGMFQRIAKTHPLDCYWLWTPEDWTWGGNKPEQYNATLADIRAAQAALDRLGHPFKLATSGWVLGPQHDRAALDRDLPKPIATSCINRLVGFEFVEPAFGRIEGRPKWSIPWLEDDPNLVAMQLLSGRTRRDAADAHAYGCTGLLGIHWRTHILAPNIVTLAQAGWEQRPWNPGFGERIKPEVRTTDVRWRGVAASFPQNAIAGTSQGAIYQTCVYDLDGYHVKVPNGTYSVTLQFCEVAYDQPGQRVFGVKLQGAPVLEHLDVSAKAGKNRALDFTFKGIVVTNEGLTVSFVKETEFPFIAGLVIEGRTAMVNQPGGEAFSRRINCGGAVVDGYEADLLEAGSVPVNRGRPRDLPCDDFYTDWARAQFGPEVSAAMARFFTSLDGGPGDYSQTKATRLPRPADWIDGPGGIKANGRPWVEVKTGYAFLEPMTALRPQVKGAANLERFDYWLNSFRYDAALSQLGCTRGQLDGIVKRISGETDPAKKKRLTMDEALPVRLALARQWETMMTLLLQTVSTPGEMGTIANLEQHVLRNSNGPHFMDRHDQKLAEWSGAPLPAAVTPRKDYQGPPRLIVPTVRSVIAQGEPLVLKIIALDRQPMRSVVVNERPLGGGQWREIPAKHVARAVYSVTLPVAAEDFEYRVTATTAAGLELHWPASAPAMNQTVILRPLQE
jgi:hypothetical protein